MKKFLLKVSKGHDHSFSLTHEESDNFYGEYHYHPEIEISLVLSGEGTRFIGDSFQRFFAGDLVLVGSNLPHVWKRSENYTGKCSSIVIHFSPNFLGEEFINAPELKSIRRLLEETSRGIQLYGTTEFEISAALKKMVTLTQPERLILLLDILRRISNATEKKLLSGLSITKSNSSYDSERIRKVHEYMVSNFRNRITLEDVAHQASMSPTAFCRYFKDRTRRTFSTFLNEIRIAHACELLVENKMKISHISSESGFNNISHFNERFKSMMNCTPQQYQKRLGNL